ncbi:MAG TPA: hypothetical protein VML55_24550 [Planctomycetaceae bacterium]|nr:hypothetical protein [Planctomycetaceae bacterium]
MNAVPGSAARADSPGSFRYPRVYGATGRPYGPTQAHYQYQRQYGRPWHGEGGLTAHGFGHSHHGRAAHHFGGFVPYGYHAYGYATFPFYGYSGADAGWPGYADYGPVHSYLPAAPVVIQPHPFFYGPNPFDNPVLNHAREENDVRWNQPLFVEPVDKAPPKFLEPSTVEAKLKSMRSQGYGDVWLRKTDFVQAYLRYKQAVNHARDRSEPYFRLAMAYAGMGHHTLAVRELKRGLERDPSWPSTGDSLDEVFGEDNQLTKSAIVGRAVAWVREDVRDPDRLFLLGVLLHFDDDERSQEFFQAAYRLAGGGRHLAAFLNPVEVEPAAGADPVIPQGEPLPGDDPLPLPPVENAVPRDGGADEGLIPPPPRPAEDRAPRARREGPALPALSQ